METNKSAAGVEEVSLTSVAAPLFLECKYAGLTLKELGPAIARLHQGAEGLIVATKVAAKGALQCALQAGGALLLAKDGVPHGEWMSWLRQNVQGLSSDQATRYMKLAREIPHVRNLDQLKTIRAAYIATGVVKESGKKGRKREPAPVLDRETALTPSDFLSRFRSLRVFLEQHR